jgi:hypothetical protein
MKLLPLHRLIVLLSADCIALAVLRPDWHRMAAELSAPHRAVRDEGPDVLAAHLATCVLWAVLCWLAVGLVAATFAHLPGAVGAGAHWVSCALLPGALRRCVAGVAGIGVLVGPGSAFATPRPLPPPLPPASAPALAALPAPLIPARTTATPHARAKVVVSPGDCLWSIAANELGQHATPSAIARRWPAWYATNRAVIGADPALLLPGQVLQSPDDTDLPS